MFFRHFISFNMGIRHEIKMDLQYRCSGKGGILFKEKQIAHMDYLRHEMQISKNIERIYNMKDRRIAE